MRRKTEGRFLPGKGGKAFYLMMFTLLAVAGLGLLLLQNSGGTVTASSEETAGKRARPDQLSFALDLRAAAEYTAYAKGGIRSNGAEIRGASGDALRGDDNQAGKDLERAFSAIKQLPCQAMGTATFSGGAFEPGVYCASTADLRGALSLDGQNNPNSVFVFRVSGSLKASAGFDLNLANGASAGNVYFVADEAEVEAGTSLRGNILATGDIVINAGAKIAGKTLSLDGTITATEASVAPAAPGVLQICKQQQGTGLDNRIFRFTVGGQTVEVPVGQCSGPVTLEEGNYTITEQLDGRLITSGTFNGRFRLVDVNSPTPGALGTVNLPARTANVFIRPGDISNQTVVNFVNTFAVIGTIEICKRSVAPTAPPASAAPVNDQDVTGFFDFTVDAIPNTSFTVPVGQCSGPISVNVPTGPGAEPQPATIRVTELAEPGFTLESASTFPANRFISLTLNQGIRNTTACSTIGGGAVPAGCLLSPNNNGGGFVTATVVEGGAASQTTINFFNRSNPGRVKVCKIAGPGIPEGTRFRFEVRGLAPSNPFPGPYLPGVNVVRFVNVIAGPAAQGGFCNFVEGTFIIGSNVLVTELGAIDPIAGDSQALARSADDLFGDKSGKSSIFSVVKSGDSTISNESSAVSSFAPGTLMSVHNPSNLTQSAAATTPEALSNLVTESGKVILSTDAAGTNGDSATLQVQKPAGATVRRAFLAAATIPNNTTLVNGDITLNGSSVSFTATAANNLPGAADNVPPGIANNYWGEVTSLVKPTIDAAAAGTVNITVVENAAKRASIDGVILAVIFDDPSLTFNNSISLFFGALDPAGETISLPLVAPVNSGAPGFALNMSVGISFSYQGDTSPPLQFSTIDVGSNTRPLTRMTSSAGGEDDGLPQNGALITVGGVGDSPNNPANPNSTANGDPRQDDELYNLAPFVSNGDTTINVRTTNPSQDDNIFFASIFTGGNTIGQPVTETISLSPQTATNPVGTSHTVTATLAAGTQPISGRQVRFRVLTGPGAGATGNANTAANGQANFTYTNNGTPGVDTIQACFTNTAGTEVCSNIVNKIWVEPVRSTPISRIRSSCGFVTAPVTVQGITVNPNPNLNTGQVVFTARREVCEVEYTNFIFRPTLLKICKIAGPGVAVGTPFTFDVVIDTEGGLFPGLTVAPVTVQAGPASQGGFCAFAQGPYTPTNTNPPVGTFRVGSRVSITERQVSGLGNPTITSPTGTPGACSPANPRCATLTLGFPNGFNEIAFTNSTATGTLSPQRAMFDFDGDNKSDASIFRNGLWAWIRSTNGQTAFVNFGVGTDVTVPADFDGDQTTDVAVFRNGEWYILQSSDGQFRGAQFGAAGDIPQPGDFDGDGKADLAVFRPSNGSWYILQSRDGFTGVQFGTNGDRPVAGDYDGDKRMDVAVNRAGAWYILGSRDGFSAVQFGTASDRLVPADYDGDGKTDAAVYRDGAWYMLRSRDGFTGMQFGIASDRPVAADYNGDGRADVAVFRDGTWHMMLSGQTEASYATTVLGGGTDVAVPGSFVR
jgi:hypothetical protein